MPVDDANLAVMKTDVIAKLEANIIEKAELKRILKEIEMIETTSSNRDMMYDTIVTDHAAL